MKTQAHMSALFWFVTILWTAGSYGAVVLRDPHKIVVAISDQVTDPSDPSSGYHFLQELQDDITAASQILYQSTESRTYFEEIVILLPPSWRGANGTSKTYSIDTADIKIVPEDKMAFTKEEDVMLSADLWHPDSYSRIERITRIADEWMKHRYGADDTWILPSWRSSARSAPHPVVRILTRADDLPLIYLVADLAKGESSAWRWILNLLNNPELYFKPGTFMAASTYNGPDSGVGTHLKEECPPLNVIDDKDTLHACVTRISNTPQSGTVRDPGAAIRDAINVLSQYKETGGSILYLVASGYSDGETNVKELEMLERLLSNNIQLIATEASSSEQLMNFNRIVNLTEGYHFSKPPDSWSTANQKAANQMAVSSQNPIQSRRREVYRKEHTGILTTAVTDEFSVGTDLGVDTVLCIQSSQRGEVTAILTDILGDKLTFMTDGKTNWNMVSSQLYYQCFPITAAETRGLWRYSLTFIAGQGNPNTASDVTIQVLSTENNLQERYLARVDTPNKLIDLTPPLPQDTMIYAQVLSPDGLLSGLNVLVTVTKRDSGDVYVVTMKEDLASGRGIFSGTFFPPGNGFYDMVADFAADLASCSGAPCAPADNFQIDAKNTFEVRNKDDSFTTMTTTTTKTTTTTPTTTTTASTTTTTASTTTTTASATTTTDSSSTSTTTTTPPTSAMTTMSSSSSSMTSTPAISSTTTTVADPSTTTTMTPPIDSSSSTTSTSTTRPPSDSTTSATTTSTSTGIDSDTSTTSTATTTTSSTSSTATSVASGTSTTIKTTTDGDSTNVPPTQSAGFIIGLCLGIAFFIGFLLLLIYCCYYREEEEEDNRPPEIPLPESFTPAYQRNRIIPPAVLRSYDAIFSRTKKTPYRNMDRSSTPSPARNSDASLYY